MTKRRRMRLAEEQAAADAAEREAAAEERKRRRGDLLAELDKASGDYPAEGVCGWADPTIGLKPDSGITPEAARLGLDETAEDIKAITGSILRSHQHIPSDEQGNPIDKPRWSGEEGVFLTSEPRSLQSPPANPDAVICCEEPTPEEREELLNSVQGSSEVLPEVPWNDDEDLSGDQNETEFEENPE